MEEKEQMIKFGKQDLVFQTGKVAKQANGAVVVSYGGTVVLVTACMSKKPREGLDFFPLTVEYQEKTYAAGRIPGGFFKREGRPTEKEILTSRLIDRPIRPLFHKGFLNDVQVIAVVLSSDGENDSDILAVNGASAALCISDIPFAGPVAACRVSMDENGFILNPTFAEADKSVLDVVVVANRQGVVMLESKCKEVSEEVYWDAVKFGYDNLQPILKFQEEFARNSGKEKIEPEYKTIDSSLKEKVQY